jgi:nitronate monooxygenase
MGHAYHAQPSPQYARAALSPVLAAGSPWPAKYTGRTLGHPFLDQWRGRDAELAGDGGAQQAYQEGVARGQLAPLPVWASEAVDLINELTPAASLVGVLAAQAEEALALARAAGRRGRG